MKKRLLYLFTLGFLLSVMACGAGKNSPATVATSAGQNASVPDAPGADSAPADTAHEEKNTSVTEASAERKDNTNGELKIRVTDGTHSVVFRLNDTPPAKSLYDMLPIKTTVDNYGSNEKIFYPDETIDTEGGVEGGGEAGGLALFSPWGNVVMYYGDFGSYPGLYVLGEAAAGKEQISELSGTINVEAVPAEASDDAAGVFDLDKKSVRLNSGYIMPIMGLGTYSLDHDTCVNSVKALLESGGRLIDTAYMYHNEEAVGEGVRQAMEAYGIPREEIFVITKLYPNQFDDPEAAIEMALEKLDIGYIDMMLLHHPGTGDVEAYKAMERHVEEGTIRSIGLSNWYVKELTEFLPQITIMPALVQNEIHPYYQEQDVVPFIQEKGIVMQGWYPLGGRGHTAELLGDEVIVDIATAHHVSPAQVILRWNLQRGIVVIPGSSNPDHIKENLDLFGFSLTQEEMERIASLDRGEKHDWY